MLLDNEGSGSNMKTDLGRLLSLALSNLPPSFDPSPPPSTHVLATLRRCPYDLRCDFCHKDPG